MSKSIKAISAVISFAAVAGMASAANAFTWGNGYVDYYDNNRKGNTKGSYVVGVEGGVTTTDNDMYGFAEYDVTNNSYFFKGSNHFKVLPKDISVYVQSSTFANDIGSETVSLAGLGYTGLSGTNWAFKPYVGYAVKSGAFAGKNVPMVGWSAFYGNGATSFSNWTDVELDQGAKVNGGVGVWHDLTKDVYVGAQYTYSYKTVGETGFGNSVGLRLGYHF